MRRVLLLLVILIVSSYYVYGQTQSYEIKLDFWFKVDRNVNNRTSSNMRIILYYSDNSTEQIYHKDIRDNTHQPSTNLILVRTKRPIRFHITGFVNFRSTGDARWDNNIYLNNGCLDESRFTYNHSGFQNDRIDFDYSSRPILNISQPNNTLIGFDDNFTLSVENNSLGFPTTFYNWQYQTVATGTPSSSEWSNMSSSTNGQSSFSIKPSTFLNTSQIGKRVYFRIKTCNDLVSDNVIFYDLRPSSPHISSVSPTPVQCFEEENGSIKINFDRALNTGELLSISMTNTTTSVDYSEENITALSTDNSYTINKFPPGDYTIRVIGSAPGYDSSMFNTYSDGSNHSSTFTINEPTPVEFSFTKTDVWCNNGDDGRIDITASGGKGSYEYQIDGGAWIAFNNGNQHAISGLTAATYNLKVRDTNNCIAKEIVRDGSGKIVGLGTEINESIEIKEPDNPVAVNLNVFSVEPTAFGFSDGRIRAQITGGTPLANGTYNYTWIHENGTAWTTFTNVVDATDGWFLTLENAIAGKYTLTVTDANHTSATDKDGCTIAAAEFTLNEPPLLKLSLTETNPISCNNTNTFSDPFSDGELTATALGGVPLDPSDNNGLDYYYTWKKETSPGVWSVLASQTTDIASGLDVGNYAVNIVDANGITVGTASGNIITPVDVTKEIKQPELLKIELSKIDVFCNQGNDGSIDATITGGTGNYTISWNTGKTTEDIDRLVVGTYTIDVVDEKGCQAQAAITIDEPTNPLEINYTFFAPTFTGATNGWIEATVKGGTPLDSGAYTYIWEDSSGINLNAQVTEIINPTSYVIKLNDLGAGIYNLTIEDKNHPLAINDTNCTIIKSPYELFEPEPLQATLQLHTPISCNSANTYDDPYSDGALEVIAKGGVQLQPTDNNGLPYYFTWKKETSSGVWTILTTQTTNIATNLDAGNYAVNIKDANGIVIGVYVNNLLANATDVTYLFEEPPLLELSIEKQDVYCFSGSDSWAKAIITGGTPPYDVLWSNGDTTEQTSDLSQGRYNVSITDSRGCQVDGSIEINQPNTPLAIAYTAFATPSTGGVSDGWIDAQITGGTDFDDGSYTYYWQDEAGIILNTQTTTSVVGGVFQIRLNNIPKGSYYLTVEDANFPLATTGDGCTISDDEFVLYDPIEAVISVHTPISCHQDNAFNNPYSDGTLQVAVTGGLPFDTGQPYIYYWKKENSSGGFDDLNQNANIATGLSNGNYALNVADSRGVVIGVYESLNLINPTDIVFDFIEPELLQVSLTATEISCGAGNDGTATVSITGGIAPYDVQWSNGQSTATATGLIANSYVVYVTDARGCQASGNITIEQPGGLSIEVAERTNPTCYQGNDGAIALNITGGITPYTYSWNTGETTTSISNLSKGTYIFELTDANGCTTFTEVILEHPDEITIDLGENKTLCAAQTLDLDGSISDANASYVWTSDNGFAANTAQVTVSEAGTYQVTATSTLGCTATDTISVYTSNTDIDAEFLISSQVYVDQDVIVINVSDPLGETSQWVIPTGITVVNETPTTITLRFSETGNYEVGLISTQGACAQEIFKNIVVEHSSGLPSSGDTENPFIETFTLTPNPNAGVFELYIDLAEPSPIAVRVFDIQGVFIFSQPTLPTAEEYTIPMNLNLSVGTYFVILETAKETQLKRIIVNK